MFPEFAYSTSMQLILAGVAFISSFIFVYLIAELILLLYGERASGAQKSLFALCVGVVLNQIWVYGMYLIGGMNSFSKEAYVLIVTPNPVFALLYYLCGIKLLKLSPVRSIKLMGQVYIYYIAVKCVNRVLGSVFFVQTGARYNYMLDAMGQLVFLVVFLAIYFATRWVVVRMGSSIKFGERLFVNIRREVLAYFINATVIYLLMVGIVCLLSEFVVANIILLILMVLLLTVSMLSNFYRAAKNDAGNKEAHIAVLKQELLTLRGVGEADILRRANENLSLVSLLVSRREYARSRSVDLSLVISCAIDDLYIDNIDACIIIDGLLSGAIDAAARSREKRVYFAVEAKSSDVKLIIVCNSITERRKAKQAFFSEAAVVNGMYGRGVDSARRIIAGYGNCAFHIDSNKHETSAYLEIRGKDERFSNPDESGSRCSTCGFRRYVGRARGGASQGA